MPSPVTAPKPDHPGFTTAAITIPINGALRSQQQLL
jgi:hypothetical protein